ncbi:MAG: potassium-transporting ATPase subunit KdpA, partial [Desulfocapsaceae bacterium]|nr:potassium-transporting ATPase subunit KdpA [Desulfocapsaceae bacterium]
MNSYELVEVIVFFIVLLATVRPLGTFMAKVYQGERTFLSPVLLPCERMIYRLCGVAMDDEMDWKR